MTVSVMLTPAEEQLVRSAAESRGEDMDAFLTDIFKKAITQFADVVPETFPDGVSARRSAGLETTSSASGKLILGMHSGAWSISDDFDAPLRFFRPEDDHKVSQ